MSLTSIPPSVAPTSCSAPSIAPLRRFPSVKHTDEERPGTLSMYRSLAGQKVVWPFGLRPGIMFLYLTFGIICFIGFWATPLISNATLNNPARSSDSPVIA